MSFLTSIILILLIILCLQIPSGATKYSKIYSPGNDDVRNTQKIPCVIYMCEKYFHSTKKKIQGSLVIVNILPSGTPFQRNLLKYLFGEQTKLYQWALMVKDGQKKHANASHVPDKAKNYFLLLSNSKEIPNILKQLQSLPTWNPYAQVLILLIKEMQDDERNSEIMNVFTLLFMKSMINVNIMYSVYGTAYIETVTWLPYANNHCCDSVKNLVLVDKCIYDDNIKKIRTETFMDIKNKIPSELNHCPLTVSATVWTPYTVYNTQKQAFENGIEVELINTIADILKMKTMFKHDNQTRSNAINGPSFYNSLINKTADVMIGGHNENPTTRQLLSSSIPYHQDDLTWCVDKSDLAPNWSNVFAIFSLTTWIVSIVSIKITGFILYLFVKHESAETTHNFVWGILISFCVSLSCPGYYYPQKQHIRVFFITLVIYGLHFNAAYHSFLISVLTQPRYDPQVNKLSMAMFQQYRIAGGVNILTYYTKNDSESKFVNENLIKCQNIDNCLERIKIDKKLAVASSREHANSLVSTKNVIYCFPHSNNIYSYSISMLFRRHFHLQPVINEIVRRILESGIIRKFVSDSEISKVKLAKAMAESDDDDEDPAADGKSSGRHHGETYVVLKIDHVQGAFYVGLIGASLAILAFICEIIISRYKHCS